MWRVGIRSDPANGALNEAFALLAMFRGNTQEARDYMARQVDVTPYVALEHVFYALTLIGIGDLDSAEREMKSALRAR